MSDTPGRALAKFILSQSEHATSQLLARIEEQAVRIVQLEAENKRLQMVIDGILFAGKSQNGGGR